MKRYLLLLASLAPPFVLSPPLSLVSSAADEPPTKVAMIGKSGRQTQVTLDLTTGSNAFYPIGLVRLWVD